ncbi:MAG TPA: lipopeptide [Gammaproteobacteria bacterium]|nr:lipopeptide [Gammaproteobacteria bacterium]
MLLRALCLMLLLMAGLAGCGKTGPLYLPDDQPSKLSVGSEYSPDQVRLENYGSF